MAWIIQNIESIVAAAALAAILTLITLRLIKNKKQGKHLCGGGCAGCPNAGACGKITEQKISASETKKG